MIVIVIFVIISSGCSSQPQKYNKSGISFTYPFYWNSLTATVSETNLITAPTPNLTFIGAVGYPTDSLNPGLIKSQVIIISGYTNSKLKDQIVTEKALLNQNNITIISERNLTVDAVPANEITYTDKYGKDINLILVKNNKLYMLTLISHDTLFDRDKKDFQKIEDTFQVNN